MSMPKHVPEQAKKIRMNSVTIWPSTLKIFEKAAKEFGSMSALMDALGMAVTFMKEGGFREIRAGAIKKLKLAYEAQRLAMADEKRRLLFEEVQKRKVGKPWSRNYHACVVCGGTDRRHMSQGFCSRCWMNKKWNEKKGETK